MERTNLEQLVACAFAEPLRERVVQVGARCLREARICNLADEHMLELVGVLAADRCARLAYDQVADEKVVERLRNIVELGRELGERAPHEEPPHHGGALQDDP